MVDIARCWWIVKVQPNDAEARVAVQLQPFFVGNELIRYATSDPRRTRAWHIGCNVLARGTGLPDGWGGWRLLLRGEPGFWLVVVGSPVVGSPPLGNAEPRFFEGFLRAADGPFQ